MRQRKTLGGAVSGFENLERRLHLDGNVAASLQSGDLTIRGDSQDNQIVITRRSSGGVRIEGLEDTTINGQDFVNFASITDDLLIHMQQGGEDHVSIQGRFNVPDDLTARLGAGEMLIEGSFAPVTIGGDLFINGGEEGNVSIRNEVESAGETEIEAGGDVNFVGGQATVPNFSAARFNNSLNINNPYFPVVPGARYTYLSEEIDEDTGEITTQDIIVEMLPQTRKILGINVRIVRDRVFEEGRLIEDTFDWYAQDNNGNVWYFGEHVTNYEYDPQGNPTTNNDGSWQAGVDGAQAGILMEAKPRIGYSYYQEFAPGNVLDQGVGLSKNESITVPVGSYSNVFRTEESSVVEPFSFANKLYAPGVGTVVEYDLDIEDDEITQTTTLIALTLNGQPVSQVVPSQGFNGINTTGRFVGGPEMEDEAEIDCDGPVVLRGSEFEDELEVSTPEVVIAANSEFDDYVAIRTQDTVSLRSVFAEGTIYVGSNPDDVFIFESEIRRFNGCFGNGNDNLVVRDSEFDLLEADGGAGQNTFEDLGGNDFGTLRLQRFTKV
jgi:hypothetical protein